MTIVTWSNVYSVNIIGIDEQHKQLFTLINQLHDAMSQGQGNLILGSTLESLSHYASTHFADEEKLLAKVNYPDLPAQKQEHAIFIQKVKELQIQQQTGKIALTVPVLGFLKDWLVNHILVSDKKYMQYVS